MVNNSGNICKEVDKERRADFGVCDDARNMVTSKQLATKPAVKAVPLPLDRHNGRIAWYKIGSPLRIIAILRASLETRAPVGYEDDSGFHYGANVNEWFFSI
jgi:hypothetical protein